MQNKRGRPIVLKSGGKYTLTLRFFEDSRVLSSLAVETLVGADSHPIKRTVNLQILDFTVKDVLYHQPEFTLRTENTGNAVLLGYYKIDVYANGMRTKTIYQENHDNPFDSAPPQNYIYLKTNAPDNVHAQKYGSFVGNFAKGDKVKIGVSFVDVEGGSLATVMSGEVSAP